MSKKFAIPRRGAGKAKLVIRRKAAPVAPAAVDHSKVALFGSASAVALAALLTVGGMMSPAQAAPAGCTETTTGSWFCNNGGGGEQGGDINGNASDNRIEIIGGSYTLDDYPSTNVNGDGGADTIIIQTSPGKGESSIAIDGNISGDAGKDTITIGGGSFTDPTWTGWTNINGNVDGGEDDDVINITASDQMLTGINKVNGKEGNVRGGAGDDQINITNGSKQSLTIEGSVEGGDGADKITVGASDVGTITIGDKIDGGDGKDTITLTASDKSKVSVGEIKGGKDDDTIELTGKDDSEIKVSSIKGDEGKDSITITGSGNSKITIDKNIEGGEGKDTIELTASDKSKIEVAEIKGGKDDDTIELTSEDESSIKITKIDGEDGKDTITLTSTDKSKLEIDEIKGGKDDDTIELTGKDDSEIKVSSIKGDEGKDSITVTGSENAKITIDKNIEGGDGEDAITLTASDKSKIEVAEIKGGKDDDTIELTANDDSEIKVKEIKGDEGEDTITLTASGNSKITVDKNIEGGDGEDAITLTASDKSKIEVAEIKGGKDDDTIELTANDDSEIKVKEIKGDEGADTITLTASDDAKITVDKHIEGGDGEDKIYVTAYDDSEIKIGEIKGGKDNDLIVLAALDGGDITVGDIAGDEGNDKIIAAAVGRGSDVVIDDIDGGEGNDFIGLFASRGAEVRVDDIDGGDGDDFIGLLATRGGEIRVDDIDGGDDEDVIALIATKGGEIRVEDINGGDEDDIVALIATKGGEIRADDIRGGDNDDYIGILATSGGEVRVDDVEGGSGEDKIRIYADGGEIRIDDIDGGSGQDRIFLGGTTAEGTFISVDNIDGGRGDDEVKLSGLVNIGDVTNFRIDGEIDGGRGFDTLIVTDESALSLDEVRRFQELYVVEGSYLQLTQSWVKFNGNDEKDGLVLVDATSYLKLSNPDADLDTGNVVLEASGGENGYRSIYTGRDAGWLDQTGGVLDVSGNTVTGTAYTQVDLSDTEDSTPNPLLPDATFINRGTIALHNGIDDVVGDRFTINGNYEGGGNLLIDTYLGASNSPTDILVINGDVAPGSITTIYVNNTNTGEGVLTGSGLGQGIKVVDVSEWGTSPTDTFQLARNSVSGQREVMAGAYSYRLFQDPDNELTLGFGPMYAPEDTGAGDWYLRAGYTAQATGYATAPSAIQRHFYAGLDTLHKRLGEVRQQDQLEGRNADLAGPVTKAPAYQPVPAPKFQMWGRGGGSDLSYDVSNGWDFSQQSWGLQAGGDYTFDYDSWRITAGAFGGYGWSDVDVDGDWTSWGGSSSLNIDGWNAGIYASIRQVGLVRGAGFYTDLVGKVDVLDLDISSSSNVTANTNATVWGGSIEMGYGFELSNSWVLQPQAQLAYVSANQDAYVDSIGTYVTPGDAESLIGRLGLQVQSTFVMATGQTVTPYAIFNVNSEFLGDNKTNVAGTILTSDINGTWYNAGIGFTADLNGSVALFGNGEYNFGDVQGWAGQGGVKVRW